MFHYFLKVVSTQFRTLDGQIVNSHQYSVTHFERDLSEGMLGQTREGLQVHHSASGMPGEQQQQKRSGSRVARTVQLTRVICRRVLHL